MTVDLEYDKKKSELIGVERTLRNIRTLILGLGPTLQGRKFKQNQELQLSIKL